MNKDLKKTLLDEIKRDIINYGLTVSPEEKTIVSNIIKIICSYYFREGEEKVVKKEKKIPEKIEEKEIEVTMAIGEEICANKINEIIDYLESKGDE